MKGVYVAYFLTDSKISLFYPNKNLIVEMRLTIEMEDGLPR